MIYHNPPHFPRHADLNVYRFDSFQVKFRLLDLNSLLCWLKRLYIILNLTISAVSSHQRAPRFSMVGEEKWRIPIPQTWPSHWLYRIELVWIGYISMNPMISPVSPHYETIFINSYLSLHEHQKSQNISQHISVRNCIHFRAGLCCTSFGGENPARIRRSRECRDAAGGWSGSPRRWGQAERDPWGFPMGVPQHSLDYPVVRRELGS